jgi:hypothetical protein
MIALKHGTQRIDIKSLSLVADPELEALRAKGEEPRERS